MAKSLTVAWSLPTKRTDGTTLPVSEIASSEVALSSDNGQTWQVLANVLPNTTQKLERELADGTYKIRVLEIDTLGQRGVPAIGDVVVKTVAPPAAPTITSITVT